MTYGNFYHISFEVNYAFRNSVDSHNSSPNGEMAHDHRSMAGPGMANAGTSGHSEIAELVPRPLRALVPAYSALTSTSNRWS